MGALNTTWKHIRRSPYQATTAIITLFLTLLLSGIFFITSTASIFILQYFEGKPQITVFFNDKANQTDVDALKKTLTDSGKVTTMKYVSKEDALAIYKEQNKNDPLLLEMVTADILPASLEVSTSDPKYLSELEPLIKQSPNIEEIVYQKDVVDTLILWTNAIRLVVGVLAVLLATDAILIIVTITSMKIALRREEVEILRLVGASPWYIRLPFVWEGGLYGIMAAFLAWIIITALIVGLRHVLLVFLGIIPVINSLLTNPLSMLFIGASLGFVVILMFIGFLLGSFGSLLAVNRYLKV